MGRVNLFSEICQKNQRGLFLAKRVQSNGYVENKFTVVTWEFPVAIFFILVLVVYFVLPPTDAT